MCLVWVHPCFALAAASQGPAAPGKVGVWEGGARLAAVPGLSSTQAPEHVPAVSFRPASETRQATVPASQPPKLVHCYAVALFAACCASLPAKIPVTLMCMGIAREFAQTH